MTDNNEIDIEVGGSIRTSNTEETVAESRKGSIAKEESALEKNSRCAIEKAVIWNAFKSIVFFICLIFLIIQSVEFLGIYYQYPTNIVMEIAVAKEFKLPALTFCFRNTISFERYCLEKVGECEKPRNLDEFCKKQDDVCEEVESPFEIPMQDDFIRTLRQGYLFFEVYNDDEHLFWKFNYSSKVRTFVRDMDNNLLYLKCYSENLHLYQSGSELKTKKLNFNDEADVIYKYEFFQTYIKPFYPPDTPQVFFAIHSPYVPLDPIVDLQPIRSGKEYKVYVQLEKEEHLLPPPFQTNCVDNGPSKDAKEFTNPNSYQVCMGLCRSEYRNASEGCSEGMTMMELKDLCFKDYDLPHISSEQKDELQNKQDICFQNCRQGCLKLQYNYKIKEKNSDTLNYDETSSIALYVKNPEVTVLRHVPLYGSGEIFSHVGGLLGCWLGISVFTFTDITEKFFRKLFRLKKKGKKEEKEKSKEREN